MNLPTHKLTLFAALVFSALSETPAKQRKYILSDPVGTAAEKPQPQAIENYKGPESYADYFSDPEGDYLKVKGKEVARINETLFLIGKKETTFLLKSEKAPEKAISVPSPTSPKVGSLVERFEQKETEKNTELDRPQTNRGYAQYLLITDENYCSTYRAKLAERMNRFNQYGKNTDDNDAPIAMLHETKKKLESENQIFKGVLAALRKKNTCTATNKGNRGAATPQNKETPEAKLENILCGIYKDNMTKSWNNFLDEVNEENTKVVYQEGLYIENVEKMVAKTLEGCGVLVDTITGQVTNIEELKRTEPVERKHKLDGVDIRLLRKDKSVVFQKEILDVDISNNQPIINVEVPGETLKDENVDLKVTVKMLGTKPIFLAKISTNKEAREGEFVLTVNSPGKTHSETTIVIDKMVTQKDSV